MSSDIKITGRIISAGRVLAGVGRQDFARIAGLADDKMAALEDGGSALVRSEADKEAVFRALDYFGIVVISEDENMGAGVRLKFTRQDVQQITRLEAEGGIVGADDAP